MPHRPVIRPVIRPTIERTDFRILNARFVKKSRTDTSMSRIIRVVLVYFVYKCCAIFICSAIGDTGYNHNVYI